MLSGVYEEQAHPPAAQIVADVPLLRAGLTRAATHAGFQPVASSETTDIVLRSADQASRGAHVDVCVDLGAVTLTVHQPVNDATWQALRSLITQLLETADPG